MRRDDLARFINYDAFRAAAVAAIDGALATGAPVSLLSLELDAAQKGESGDAPGESSQASGELVQLVCRNLRSNDFVTRGTGGEIIVLLPGTRATAATDVADRIGGAVRTHVGWTGTDARQALTASLGVASVPLNGESLDNLLERAREARSRVSGRGGDGSLLIRPESQGGRAHRLDVGRFTGRTDHLRSLVRLLDDAANGVPRVAVISGEVGIGTTALARQLATEARLRGGSLVSAEGRSAEITPAYGIWTALLEQLHRIPGMPRRKWHELPALHSQLRSDAATAPRGGSRYRLFAEISQMIRGTAGRQPLVLLLEEMQRADAASWDALEHVLSELGSARVLCCLTIRPERGAVDAGERRARLERIRPDLEIALSRLTRDEVKTWVEGAFGQQEVGRDLLAFIYRHTEGNPLFITHLLRALEEDGSIWRDGERWKWKPVSELQVPARLQSLLSLRAGRLAPAAQAVLLAAAVVGRPFDVQLLAAAAGVAEEEVSTMLATAADAGIVEPTGARGSGNFAFTHAAIGESLIAEKDQERLARVHAAVAGALEGSGAADPGEIAIHHDRGGDSGAAFAAAMEAARHADRLYAPAIANDYMRLAVRNADTPARLAEAREGLAELAERRGRYEDAEELCDLAIEWFAGQGDRERSIVLRRMRERVRSQLGQPAQTTLESLRVLDGEAAELGLDAERVSILTLMSQTFGRLGDRKAAERIAGECVAMAERIGDRTLLADSLNRYAITLDQEESERARETYRKVLHLYEQTADTRGQARANINLGVLLQLHGELPQAEEALTRAIGIARTAGLADQWGLASLNLGVMVMNCGDHARARDLFSEALRLFAAVKNSELQLYALYNLAHLERVQGMFESAAGLYDVAVSLANRVGQLDVELGAIGGAGFCRFADGATAAAREALEVIEARMTGRDDWFQGRELIEALRLAIALEDDDVERAGRIFEGSVRAAEEADLYGAAWLASTMGPALRDRGLPVQPVLDRVQGRAVELGLNVTERTIDALGASRRSPA
jgi:diguanylate cyclase (GGDEF)-like protein